MKTNPALNGVVILEMGDTVAVQACGRLFAACGAQVIRMSAAPSSEEPGAAAFVTWMSQNKSVSSAPASPDLVIAGPDEETIAAAFKHGAPVLALTWFDEQGPYSHLNANDAMLQAMTGVTYSFGLPQGPPIIAQGHAPQLVGALVGYIAALAALQLPRAARPKRIDTNVFEAALCFAEPGAVGASALGGPPRRLGINRFAPTYPCSIYPASDGWVGLTALTPPQWRALLDLLGRNDLAPDKRFATTLGRLGLADEVDSILMPLFAQKPISYWVGEGIARRIPITPVPRPGELPSMEHWRVRESFTPLPNSSVQGPNVPFRMEFDGIVQKPTSSANPLAPLAGIRVVDFSMGWAGPLATRMLADLGADVVKIESLSHPDWWRSWEGAPSDLSLLEMARNFLDVNRGKRGTLLDLATLEGMTTAKALISRADIVIENLGPGVMARLGIDVHGQRELRPGIISVAMAAFGNGGPLSGIRAYGSTVEQASGMPFINGRADWAPCLQHVAYGDPVAGLFAAAAILTALTARPRFGGAGIDLAQVECLFQLDADAIVGEQARAAQCVRAGSRSDACAPRCVVAARGDGEWLAVAVETNAAWRGFCQVIGAADWSNDPAFADCAKRNAQADKIEAALAAWAKDRDARDAAQTLPAAGVAAARVMPVNGLLADPQLAASDFWLEMDRAISGPHMTGATPFKFDGARPMVRKPAPTLGQHTDEVLAELRA